MLPERLFFVVNVHRRRVLFPYRVASREAEEDVAPTGVRLGNESHGGRAASVAAVVLDVDRRSVLVERGVARLSLPVVRTCFLDLLRTSFRGAAVVSVEGDVFTERWVRVLRVALMALTVLVRPNELPADLLGSSVARNGDDLVELVGRRRDLFIARVLSSGALKRGEVSTVRNLVCYRRRCSLTYVAGLQVCFRRKDRAARCNPSARLLRLAHGRRVLLMNNRRVSSDVSWSALLLLGLLRREDVLDIVFGSFRRDASKADVLLGLGPLKFRRDCGGLLPFLFAGLVIRLIGRFLGAT